MDKHQRTTRLSPQTKRAQGGVGAPHLHEGGPAGNATGPRDAGDRGDRRYADGPAGSSGHRQHETKDAGWTSRQGGSQEAKR